MRGIPAEPAGGFRPSAASGDSPERPPTTEIARARLIVYRVLAWKLEFSVRVRRLSLRGLGRILLQLGESTPHLGIGPELV